MSSISSKRADAPSAFCRLRFRPARIQFLRHRPQGDRHGQRRAKKQSGGQETQKGEDQGYCRSAKSKDRGMAANRRDRQEEVATGWRDSGPSQAGSVRGVTAPPPSSLLVHLGGARSRPGSRRGPSCLARPMQTSCPGPSIQESIVVVAISRVRDRARRPDRESTGPSALCRFARTRRSGCRRAGTSSRRCAGISA